MGGPRNQATLIPLGYKPVVCPREGGDPVLGSRLRGSTLMPGGSLSFFQGDKPEPLRNDEGVVVREGTNHAT